MREPCHMTSRDLLDIDVTTESTPITNYRYMASLDDILAQDDSDIDDDDVLAANRSAVDDLLKEYVCTRACVSWRERLHVRAQLRRWGAACACGTTPAAARRHGKE